MVCPHCGIGTSPNWTNSPLLGIHEGRGLGCATGNCSECKGLIVVGRLILNPNTQNAAIEATDLAADVVGPDALDADSEWAYLISFLPGLKSAGGTEQILRNTIGERVLGLPPEPRLDKGVPFSELRALEKQAVS